jgi:hypothetical protein
MVYDINPTSMETRTALEILSTATCPSCKSNAKDKLSNQEWKNFGK